METIDDKLYGQRYKKLPRAIEAEQFNDNAASYTVLHWINEGQYEHNKPFAEWINGELIIPTLEGTITASKGDYIIKGVQGEFYPCKPDIFAETYERVKK